MATSNYSLPQWRNGEEFHVIGQLNPAFTTIDSSMQANKAAAGAAQKDAASALAGVTSARSEIKAVQSTANTALTAANAAKASADSKVAYGKVKLVEDTNGNGVIVTLGVVNG